METIKETKYLIFVQLNRDKDRKTEVITINNRHHNITIGVIKWYSNWRQYCFFPNIETIWNIDCLNDINSVIADLMKARNKKKIDDIKYIKAIHKKSGRKYIIINDDVINATNLNDGQIMIYYSGNYKNKEGIGNFVREKTEFFEKFEIIKD